MGAQRKTISEMPAWLKALPGNARLSRAELAAVLGYSSLGAFEQALSGGKWPRFSEIETRGTGIGKGLNGTQRIHCKYRVSDVRKVVRELIASQK